MKITYTTNNSGGDWWLEDSDWEKLRKAGWNVRYFSTIVAEIDAEEAKTGKAPKFDIRKFYSKKDQNGNVRWLGAIAKEAEKEFETPGEAMKEFEKVTGMHVDDEGCGCCGPPHSFSWQGGYASGENCLQHMYEDAPTSLREALEKMEKGKK